MTNGEQEPLAARFRAAVEEVGTPLTDHGA